MQHTQADLEVALRQLKDAEERIAEQQARIARLKRHGQSTGFAEDLLRALLQGRELLRTHLATMTDPHESHDISKVRGSDPTK